MYHVCSSLVVVRSDFLNSINIDSNTIHKNYKKFYNDVDLIHEIRKCQTRPEKRNKTKQQIPQFGLAIKIIAIH